MKKEYQDELIQKFPGFFDHLQKDQKIQTTDNPIDAVKELISQESIVIPIQFGFECGNGWYWLIYELMENIYNYCKWNKIDIPKITQIKEKYGTLSFYYYGGDKMIDGMIWLAEHLSGKICDVCGTNVNVGQTKGWIYTICEKCKEKNPNIKNMEWVRVSKK